VKKKTIIRYVLFQLPGFALAVIVVASLKILEIIPLWFALAAIPLWIAKDALLFPLTWQAYEMQDDGHPMTGRVGVTEGEVNPEGKARFGQERWKVRTEEKEDTIPAGTRVRVSGGAGLTLTVQREWEE